MSTDLELLGSRMHIVSPNTEVSDAHLKLLAAVAQAGTTGMVTPQRAILDALQKVVYRVKINLECESTAAMPSLDALGDKPEEGRQLVRLMLVMAIADGLPGQEQMQLTKRIAQGLGVDEPAVGVLEQLSRNRHLRFRAGFMRRSHIRNYFANTYRLGGAKAVIKGILVFRGVLQDAAMSARYHGLRGLPSDTLGRCFHDHCAGAGIAFPGEKSGFPEGAVYHDFTHVLAGYDTSPEGEMKAAAFQAGYTRGDWDFFTLLFALVIHTAGVNLAPFPMPRLPGRIGQPGLALEVFKALARGNRVNRDLGESWDFWQVIDQPIEEVRKKLAVPPRDEPLLAA